MLISLGLFENDNPYRRLPYLGDWMSRGIYCLPQKQCRSEQNYYKRMRAQRKIVDIHKSFIKMRVWVEFWSFLKGFPRRLAEAAERNFFMQKNPHFTERKKKILPRIHKTWKWNFWALAMFYQIISQKC